MRSRDGAERAGAKGASASASSPMLRVRLAGSFSRQRSTTASRAGGSSGRRLFMVAGWSATTAAQMAEDEAPVKGRAPVSSS